MTHKPTILIVDDDPMLVESLQFTLLETGFNVLTTRSGQQVLSLIRERQPDLVVLDIMLPDLSGWQVCQQIRQESAVPIIILSGRNTPHERVMGLDLGADDYLTKPFDLPELLARIRAIFRRTASVHSAINQTKIRIGQVWLDPTAYRAYKAGRLLTMTQKEYELLHTLMRNAGQVISRADLMDRVWGITWLGDTRTLDVHVRWLREKIETNPGQPRYIQTVRGVGYRFIDPVELQ